mmetsp:Transcript_3988/g.5548  ORF Transcript_3988/g.5548 Transcript_3988/m.5548 type:complete len:126 (-) Transcript_3988:321-698(-)
MQIPKDDVDRFRNVLFGEEVVDYSEYSLTPQIHPRHLSVRKNCLEIYTNKVIGAEYSFIPFANVTNVSLKTGMRLASVSFGNEDFNDTSMQKKEKVLATTIKFDLMNKKGKETKTAIDKAMNGDW